MADEFMDLTDDEETGEKPAAGKKKKEKPAKEPKPPKVKSPKEPKPKKGKPKGATTKGEKKGGSFLLALIIFILILSGAIAGSIVFNFFGARDWLSKTLISIVVSLDPEFATIDSELTRRESELSEREGEIYKLEAAIAEYEEDLTGIVVLFPADEYRTFADYLRAYIDELIRSKGQQDTREAQLDRRSAALDRREEQIGQRETSALPLFRRSLTNQELDDMTSLSRSFTQMSPEAAASILTELADPNHVASILYFMGERNAASILAAMEVDFAAELTEILLVD